MYKFYKQMFNNKIIHIIAIIWLVKQSQLKPSVAGQPAMSAATKPFITAAGTTPQQLRDIKNIEKYFVKTYDLKNYSSDSDRNTTITSNSITAATANNKLNVNDTDTQITFKLKDATAINDYTSLKKKFTLNPATDLVNGRNYTKDSNRCLEFTANMTPISVTTYAPVTVANIPSSPNINETYAGGQLSQSVSESNEISALLNQALLYTFQPYISNKSKSFNTKTILHLNMQKDSQKTVTNPEQTTKKSLIMNINLISEMDLSMQQQLKEKNKKLHPRLPIDKQETNAKREENAGLIKIGTSLPTANESKQGASDTLRNLQIRKNKSEQKTSHTTSLSIRGNENENSAKSELKFQKKSEKNKRFGSEKNNSSNKIKRHNKSAKEEKSSKSKIFTTKQISLQNVATKSSKSAIQVTEPTHKKILDKRNFLLKPFTTLSEKVQNIKQLLKSDAVGKFKDSLKVLNATYKVTENKSSDKAESNIVRKNELFQNSAIKSPETIHKSYGRPSIVVAGQNTNDTIELFSFYESEMAENRDELEKDGFKFREEFNRELFHVQADKNKLEKQETKNIDKKLIEKSKKANKKDLNIGHSQTTNDELKTQLEKKGDVDVLNARAHNKEHKQQHQQILNIADIKNHSRKFLNENVHNNEIPFNTTFLRNKRLHNNNLNNIENTTRSSIIIQNSQAGNSTELSRTNMKKKKSNAFESISLKENSEMKSPPKEDTQSIVNINKRKRKFRNESVELETENMSKIKFIGQQMQPTLSTVSENGNNIMKINSIMNNKQLDANLNEYNQPVDNGKHVFSEINAISAEATTNATLTYTSLPKTKEGEATTTTTYLIKGSNTGIIYPTAAATKPYLFKFQTTLITDSATPLTPTAHPLNGKRKIIENNITPYSITTAKGISSTHDLINTKLITGNEETKIMATTDTSSIKQLVSTTSTSPFTPSASSSSSSLATLSFATTITSTTSTSSWPVKHASVMEGNVILGGLMMVHSREDSITCGPIMPQGGIQALEAMLYTLDQVNMQQLLPNITLGAHILDDCDKDTYGLEMAVDFIKERNCTENLKRFYKGLKTYNDPKIERFDTSAVKQGHANILEAHNEQMTQELPSNNS